MKKLPRVKVQIPTADSISADPADGWDELMKILERTHQKK